jgi:hypothetical protein
VAARDGGFAVLEATPGGTARAVAAAARPTVPQRPAWSRSGRLAFVCRSFQLCVALPGGRVRAVTASGWPRRWTYDSQPAWSRDGRRLAFSSNRGGSYRIFVVGASGGRARALPRTSGGGENPSWSPDGTRIAFDRRVDGKASLYLVHVDGRGRRQLGAGGHASAPAWSPDGQTIAYTLRTPTGSHIAVIGADGRRGRVVTRGKFHDDHVAWSPDGRFLAFDSDRRGRLGVWVVASSGGRPRFVAGSRAELAFLPAFRPAAKPVGGIEAASERGGDARLVSSYLRWATIIGNDFRGIARHGPEAAAAVGHHAHAAVAELGAIRPVTPRGTRLRAKVLDAFNAADATAQAFQLAFADYAQGNRSSGTAHIRDGFRAGREFAQNAQAATRIAGLLS